MVPISNLKFSVSSVELFVIGRAQAKLRGPIGVKTFTDNPVDDLIEPESSNFES